MANKRESAFCWDKTERGHETYNLAFSNIEMKTAKKQFKHVLFCDKAQNSVIQQQKREKKRLFLKT